MTHTPPRLDPVARLVERLAARYSKLLPPGRTAIECAAEVLHVMRRTWDGRRTRWLLGPAVGRAPNLTDAANRIDWRGVLSPGEGRFVAAIDGSRDLESVLEESHLDPLHAAQVMCALALVGAVVFLEPIELEEDDDRPSHVGLRAPFRSSIELEDPFPRRAAS